MRLNMKSIAIEYYEGLIGLGKSNNEINKNLGNRIQRIGREKFIKDYPLSALDVVNHRTFWEICMELDIVEKPFFCNDEEYNDFEKKLHEILTSMMNYGEKSSYDKEDIKKLFRQYRVLV
ncbi:hypothetical protein [Dethiothermospora halolimnae]|uniref:hypothetical protein n=1 Tax=Dethiothermospora halolimnae TaxID=3114390 RepID=UPI003CCC209C